MALDNKSLVSSANYLTDLNSTYSKAIVLYKNNILIPSGIAHTIEATISYFDKVELIDKELILKAPVVIDSNTSMLAELANIVSEISAQIDDAIILNSSAINGTDLLIDISVSTDSTILRTLNIKVKYGGILKYDLDSTSNEYIQILTNAGLFDLDMTNVISDIGTQILHNLDEILLVNDKANDVSINTDLVSTMKSEVTSMRDETNANRDSSANSATSALDSKNETQELYDLTVVAKNSAQASASNALISEQNADISETNALSSANTATTKATEASNSADIATTKASESSASASSALTSANSANLSEANALSYKNSAEASSISAEESSDTSSSQASIATQKANEASISASNADESEANALASKNLAEKWASEAEDVVVASGKYSAYHYMLKAEEYAASASSEIDDNNSSTITTYSSNKINNTFYTKFQNDILLDNKVPIIGDFVLDLGEL